MGALVAANEEGVAGDGEGVAAQELAGLTVFAAAKGAKEGGAADCAVGPVAFDELNQGHDSAGEEENSCDDEKGEIALDGRNGADDNGSGPENSAREKKYRLDMESGCMTMEWAAHSISKEEIFAKSNLIFR